MLVSVIVPNYNHERFLAQRLESIFAQTFTDYEVIVLDDASTDTSRDVIQHYRHYPRISHVAYNKANSGSPFKQWRKGLALAKGDWIWIAESDDFCAAGMLAALVTQATACKDAVLSYCQSKEVDENGNGWRDMRWFTAQADKQHWDDDFCIDGLKEISNYLWRINSIPNASAVLFKKAAYDAAGREFEGMSLCGDWLLWLEIARQGSVCFCAEPLNFFRTHAATTRTHEKQKWQKRLREEYTVAKRLLTLLPAGQHKKIKNRMTALLRSYCSTFSTPEALRLVLKSSSNEHIFPAMAFLHAWLTHFVRKTGKHLLTFMSSRPFWRRSPLHRN